MEDTVLGLLSGEKALRLEPRLWSHFLQQRQRRGHMLWSWTAPMRHCPDVLRFWARSQRVTEPLLPWRGAHHFEHGEHVEFLSASRNIPGVGRPGRDGLRQPKCFEIT